VGPSRFCRGLFSIGRSAFHRLWPGFSFPRIAFPFHGQAFDFAIDDDLDVWLLEGNGAPDGGSWYQAVGAGGLPEDMYASGVELVVKVQTEAWPRTSPPLFHGSWELVYNEAREACEGHYDPCAIFAGKSQAEIAAAWPYAAPDWPPPGAPFEMVKPKWWYGKQRAEIVKSNAEAIEDVVAAQ